MERGQFTFYRSYYDALRLLSPADREQAVMALCAYAQARGLARQRESEGREAPVNNL